jgi:dihydrodipicolinate synthase/N-acetylneuraminate lyase
MKPQVIGGVLPAAITPRSLSGTSIDTGAGLDLISFLCSQGVDGITLFGSTGEFVHFTPEDRVGFAALAVKHSSVPILVNASHSTLEVAVQIARSAMESGAAGVLIMPPHYYRYTQDAIRAYCLEFAERVKARVYLYNIPQFTSEIRLETALDLLASGQFAGIKDSKGDWEDFVALERTGLTVLVGSDSLYSRAARCGAAGTISGVASVLPELVLAIDRCVRSGGDPAPLDVRLADFLARALSFPFPIAFREAAAVRGLKPGPHPTPVGDKDSRRLDEFREWFAAWLRNLEADLHQPADQSVLSPNSRSSSPLPDDSRIQ